MDTKEFVIVWEQSNSAIEVAEHFSVSATAARAKAAYLRKYKNIPLKDMRLQPKADYDELRRLVAAQLFLPTGYIMAIY